MKVVIVGARDRSSVKSLTKADLNPRAVSVSKDVIDSILARDKTLIRQILETAMLKYGQALTVVSMGCDDGVGLLTCEIANGLGFRVIEASVHFHGERARSDHVQFYLARNALLLEVGDDFHILVNNKRRSMVENLADRLRDRNTTQQTVGYRLYDEQGKVVETNIV